MKNFSIILLVSTIVFIVGVVLLSVYLPSNYVDVEVPSYPTIARASPAPSTPSSDDRTTTPSTPLSDRTTTPSTPLSDDRTTTPSTPLFDDRTTTPSTHTYTPLPKTGPAPVNDQYCYERCTPVNSFQPQVKNVPGTTKWYCVDQAGNPVCDTEESAYFDPNPQYPSECDNSTACAQGYVAAKNNVNSAIVTNSKNPQNPFSNFPNYQNQWLAGFNKGKSSISETT